MALVPRGRTGAGTRRRGEEPAFRSSARYVSGRGSAMHLAPVTAAPTRRGLCDSGSFGHRALRWCLGEAAVDTVEATNTEHGAFGPSYVCGDKQPLHSSFGRLGPQRFKLAPVKASMGLLHS
eukprot:scaffold1173_cov405-Prasinococcus_capsulatus_cf.AAC.4